MEKYLGYIVIRSDKPIADQYGNVIVFESRDRVKEVMPDYLGTDKVMPVIRETKPRKKRKIKD